MKQKKSKNQLKRPVGRPPLEDASELKTLTAEILDKINNTKGASAPLGAFFNNTGRLQDPVSDAFAPFLNSIASVVIAKALSGNIPAALFIMENLRNQKLLINVPLLQANTLTDLNEASIKIQTGLNNGTITKEAGEFLLATLDKRVQHILAGKTGENIEQLALAGLTPSERD